MRKPSPGRGRRVGREVSTLIRAGALAGYEDLAASLGLDPAKQLLRVGLSPILLRNPELMIPYSSMIELLENSAADATCGDLGLQLSRRQSTDILGPVSVAIESAANLQDAVDIASRYLFIHCPAIRLSCDLCPGCSDLVDLCLAIDFIEMRASTQALDLALGVIVNCVRLLGQGQIEPVLILLPHARLAPPMAYAQALGATCAFEQAKTAVRLKAVDLSRPLVRSNAMMHKLEQTYADTPLTASDKALSGSVLFLVSQLLSTGHATQEFISRILAVPRRTMQRRLGEEGTTFERIKDDARRALVKKLIERRDRPPLASVARMLDYSVPSALTRSCHRWFGVTPSELRRSLTPPSGDR